MYIKIFHSVDIHFALFLLELLHEIFKLILLTKQELIREVIDPFVPNQLHYAVSCLPPFLFGPVRMTCFTVDPLGSQVG